VYGVLGETLNIPCVSDRDSTRGHWLFASSGINIGNSLLGINVVYKDLYELIGTGPRDFTLRIKRLRVNEPQVRCLALFSDAPSAVSSDSDITVIGKFN
jgi:hypothetical protein